MPNRFYGEGIPKLDISKLSGKLIVIEGADGSGRSTQIGLLTSWLENLGYSVVNIGIKRSTLVGKRLSEAQQSNYLTYTTMSLFYATDFADQLENKIIPALRAGAIALCDRYIYTLMARDIVRGANRDWLRGLYGFALVPDMVFYLEVTPEILVERNLQKNESLNYWESGMDMGFSNSLFDSFIHYQALLRDVFLELKGVYNFHVVRGDNNPHSICSEIQGIIQSQLLK